MTEFHLSVQEYRGSISSGGMEGIQQERQRVQNNGVGLTGVGMAVSRYVVPQWLVQGFLVTAAYYLSGRLGLAMPSIGQHITLIWLPTGIAVAALLRWNRHLWPAVYLGAFLVNLHQGSSISLAAGIAVGNTLGPVLTALWLRHSRFHWTFDYRLDVVWLILAGMAGMLLSATGGATLLWLNGLLPAANFGMAWLVWWMGDTSGVLLATPLLVALSKQDILVFRQKKWESLAIVLVLFVLNWLVFLSAHYPALTFFPILMVVWAALRFGVVGASITVLIISVMSAWGTAIGSSRFYVNGQSDLLILWFFIMIHAGISLVITALRAEGVRNETQVRGAYHRLSLIASRLPGLVYQFRMRPDGSTSLPYASNALLTIFQIDPEAVRDDAAPVLRRIHPEDYARVMESIQDSARMLTAWQHEFRVRHPDGGERWLFGDSVPEREADGSTLWHGFITDITPKKEAQIELSLAKEQAEAASRAKSEFLATMSHEIRTPMNVILGMLELLRTADMNLPDRERVELAFGAGNTLLTLINNVLDFSRMESEQLVLDHVDFDLRRLVYESAMTVAPLAHAKSIELTAFFPDVAYTAVRGDPIRLKQILINLLGNAIKFTPDGGSVELYGGPVDSDAERIHLLFDVRDSGIGVSPENHRKIFSRFTQVDSSSTRRHEGTGLGLSICKHLVEMMGGEIGMEPNLYAPSGSVFYFTVQLYKQQHSYAHPVREQNFKGIRVLAISHAGLLRALVEDALVSHGVRLDHVTEMGHAAEILRRAEEAGQPYQLVVCNQKPGMSHHREFYQLLNSNAELSFVLLTDLLDQGWDQAAELSGTAICLKKPINADRLVAAVEWLITHKGSHPVQPVQALPVCEESVQGDARVLVVDDQQANLIVTRGMLIHLGYRPEQIRTASNGQEAVDIFAREAFALVLMDCQMPVMDGFDATRAIHALERESGRGDRRVPIVAFTANITPQAQESIRACGMDGFLSKPVSLEDLRGQLRQFSLLQPCQGAKTASVPPVQAEEGRSGEAVAAPVDMSALLQAMRTIGLQEEDFREVAHLLSEQFMELLNTLQRDIEQGEYQSARATAHVVKGSMANTLFPVLQKPTRGLYEAVRDQNQADAWDSLMQAKRLFQPVQDALLAFLAEEG